MLRRLSRAWLWTRARNRSAAGDVAAALVYVQKLEARSPLKAHERAFKAGVLLRLGQYSEAEKLFSDVAAATIEPRDENERYVNLYANFVLADMRGNDQLVEILKAKAQRINCRPIFRRRLPI